LLRSTEAIVASMIILGTISTFFNMPAVNTADPVEGYLSSVLEAYEGLISTLAVSDPYSLKLLLESVIPLGYNMRVQINYYTALYAVTGTSARVPYETYLLLPTEAKTGLSYSGMESNWYRSVFTIENSGSSKLENATMEISVSLYVPDLDSDGFPEPVDLDSIMVFTENGLVKSSLLSYEFNGEKFTIGLRVNVGGIEAGQIKRLYVYYLVGDDYE